MTTRAKAAGRGVTGALAGEMRQLLAARGLRFVHRRLPAAGLELVLERRADERLRLAVARTDRAPSADELAAIGEAFGAPDGGVWGGALRRAFGGRSLFVCEMVWREA